VAGKLADGPRQILPRYSNHLCSVCGSEAQLASGAWGTRAQQQNPTDRHGGRVSGVLASETHTKGAEQSDHVCVWPGPRAGFVNRSYSCRKADAALGQSIGCSGDRGGSIHEPIAKAGIPARRAQVPGGVPKQ